MVFILTQKKDKIISVNERTNFNIGVKDDFCTIFVENGTPGERSTMMSFVLGYFKRKEDACYVMSQIFDAICNDEGYEIPREADLPELKFIRGHGTVTSMKVGHGGS